MTSSRRKFLIAMTGAPLALAGVYAASRGGQSPAVGREPASTSDETVFVLTEGKTSIAEVAFPVTVTDLTGRLPVRIEPESLGGQQLDEPQPLFFYPGRDARTFRTLLTAPLDVVPADYAANLVGRHEATEVHRNLKCSIRRGIYTEAMLTVNRSFSAPTPVMVKRMRGDFETMVEIYRRRTSRRWSEPFIQPVPGPDKKNFGDKRTYNGTKHSRHGGLDYRAPMRTPVSAINNGIVVLSSEHWVPGETICIDHGGGVFSKYMHLSRRNVREGDVVKRGDIIALSGNTGGQKPPPHLHLDLVVNGVHVDPKDFKRAASELLALEAQDQRKIGS